MVLDTSNAPAVTVLCLFETGKTAECFEMFRKICVLGQETVNRPLNRPYGAYPAGFSSARSCMGWAFVVSSRGLDCHCQSPGPACGRPVRDNRATISTVPAPDNGFAGFMLTASSSRIRSVIPAAGRRTTANGMPPPTGRAMTNNTASAGGSPVKDRATSIVGPETPREALAWS